MAARGPGRIRRHYGICLAAARFFRGGNNNEYIMMNCAALCLSFIANSSHYDRWSSCRFVIFLSSVVDPLLHFLTIKKQQTKCALTDSSDRKVSHFSHLLWVAYFGGVCAKAIINISSFLTNMAALADDGGPVISCRGRRHDWTNGKSQKQYQASRHFVAQSLAWMRYLGAKRIPVGMPARNNAIRKREADTRPEQDEWPDWLILSLSTMGSAVIMERRKVEIGRFGFLS
jgi:hypothetical protein